ncbi:MAG TPA: D-alanine--D-alanine ligase [Gammaproteobacteria bacterium]|nr:D-alanine--D-alanine ligase [Gammaproteobacteria bacterium]
MSVSRDNLGDPRRFGKVAVLMGGWSAEREISLRSGAAVTDALRAVGVDAHGVDVGADILAVLDRGRYDRAVIMLHGRGGEDGVIQGALEVLGLPYTGSGVLGSALAMDKSRTKRLWQAHALPTPAFVELDAEGDLAGQVGVLTLPVVVKPVHEGSSLGMTQVTETGQLQAAWQAARVYHDMVIAEQWIDGDEYTAAVIGREVLPLIRIETPRRFYDFTAKYDAGDTLYHCPCGLDEPTEKRLQAMALKAFDVLGCSGWGRVDFMCDRSGDAWLLEVNTVPGMTDHSLVPKAARQAGIGFNELAGRILETSLGEDRRQRGGAPQDPTGGVPDSARGGARNRMRG